MRLNDNKTTKKIIRFFLPIIVVAIILYCLGGSKSNTNAFLQAETLDTFTIPNDAVPVVYQGHIYISSVVDSVLGYFVFDTGANGLYFDSTFYANNSFREFKFVKKVLSGAGSGNPQRVIVITDTVSFRFENYSSKLTSIPVLSLKPILGDFADGLFGKQYFANNILEINYFHEYIRLHNDFNVVDTAEYVKIGMKKERNRLFVPATIQINDTISIQDYLMLDIGSGGGITITSAIANKYKLSDNVNSKILYYTKYGGISGYSSWFDFRAYSVKIGNYKLDNVTMDYSEDKRGALSRDEYAGLLGNKILERFDVVIDFINNDLYLKPNQNYSKPFNFSMLGFGYVDRNTTMNAWIVTGLHKGSNAEVAGLKIDDKIISINGTDIREIPFTEQSNFFKGIEKISLVVLRNGEEKRIEFDLEYVL